MGLGPELATDRPIRPFTAVDAGSRLPCSCQPIMLMVLLAGGSSSSSYHMMLLRGGSSSCVISGPAKAVCPSQLRSAALCRSQLVLQP